MERVREMLEWGIPDRDVSIRTGVPPNTVGRWRRGTTRAFGAAPARRPWRPPDDFSYAYLLGMYLGDGNVSVSSRGRVALRVSLDSRYPEVILDCVTAMQLTMLSTKTRVYPRHGAQMVYVQSCGKRWVDAFPQHGPGRKHERPIVLEGWQQQIVDRFFSNLSPDIRALFCASCDRLGIQWTQSNPRNISVSHRRSVAILDEFVGPKC